MGMKLFNDDEGGGNDYISKIEIDKEFARRYEHNKKREALQRYDELKKKGLIEEESESESSESESDSDTNELSKKEDIKKLFENLNKVKRRDPSIYDGNSRFFDSDSDTENNVEENRDRNNNKRKKAMYLKDVVAQHLMDKGPEFEDDDSDNNNKERKTYNEEQEELRKAVLDALNDDGDDEGDFLKVKEEGKNEELDDDDGGEFEKKFSEYFGIEGELDENNKFLKEFFEKQMWVDRGEIKDKRRVVEDGEVDELLRDEEEIGRQEKYEEFYNFRYEENAGDRVMGHARKVVGSVRKKENTRKDKRKIKEEKMKAAEIERKEELKHLKNLKKKEMEERMMKVMVAAGVRDDNDFALDLDDLEDDFDPTEYDKTMKKAFGDEYYNADDVDPGFGSNNDDDGADRKKPDFDNEDELLGLPKGWDEVENRDGFLAARERLLKQKAEYGNDDDNNEDEVGNAVEQNEESKRKKKRKMSLVKKAKEEMLEEYYKLDYEDTIGDLKTRFKYAKVNPSRYGLKTEEILMLDDRELNQYVSIKKLAPYKDREWKVPNNMRYAQKMRIRELLWGRLNDRMISKKKSSKDDGDKSKQNKSKDDGDKSSSVVGSRQNGVAELEESNVDLGKLSRRARRKRRQAVTKLSQSRMAAYQNIQPKAKSKGKHC